MFAVISYESCSVRQFTIEGSSLKESAHDDIHDDHVKGAAWSPKDGKLWSCGWDGKVRVR